MHWALHQVWARLNSELLRRLGPERYAGWIHNARPAAFDEDEFVIHFESTYAKDKLESLFKEPVTEAAREVTNRNVRVHFAVEGSSFTLPDAARLADATRAPGRFRRPRPTFDSFVEGRGNRMALRAAKAFARLEPGSPRSLLLHAPSGLGKTHLLRAIESEAAARGVPGLSFAGEQFGRYFAYAQRQDHVEAFLKKCRSTPLLLFDDLHLLGGKDEAQMALLGILRALEERGARAVLTSERHPRALEGLRPRIRNRLRAEEEVAIERPDVSTGLGLLRACAPPSVSPAVLEVIATHVQSSHKDQLHCLARLLEQGPPTAPAARAVVAEFLNQWSRGLTYADIARAVAESFGVALGDLYAADRSRPATDARQACFYLARKLLGEPFARIGDHFGGRAHATVLQACKKLRRRGGSVREHLRRIQERLEGNRPPEAIGNGP